MKYSYKSILIPLAFLLSFSGYGQSFNELMTITSDSLENRKLGTQTKSLIDKAINISEENSNQKWKATLQKGIFYSKKFEYRKTISLLKPIVENVKNDTVKTKYYGLLGSSYSYLSIPDSSIYYLRLATTLSGKSKIGSSEIGLYINLGSTYFRGHQEDLAFKEYDTAIYLMGHYNDSSSYLPVMGNAAACLMKLGKYETAKKYYEKLVSNFSNQKKFIGLIYANLGIAYNKLDDLDSAEYYFLKSIPLLKINSQFRFLGATYFNLIDIYLESGAYEKALHYAELAEPIFKETQPSRLGYLYSGFGNIYSNLNQNQKALNYYSKALNIAKENNEWNETISITRNLSQLHEKTGNYKEALYIFKENINYKDSLLEDDKLEAIEKYRIEFESEQNEKEIEQLKKLNSAKSEIIASKKKTQKMIIGIFIGLIILVLFGSYSYYRFNLIKARLKNKSKLLELDNKLALNRLSPHFIFNILNSIQYYINSDNRKKANHYLTVFADLLRKFLDSFSEEHHKLEDELKLVKEYVELERMLSNDKFEFILSKDEKVNQQLRFPTMLLQPLIENSIKHGTSLNNPLIKLIVEEKNGMIHCVIEDNGSGIDELKDNPNSRGIELIKQRIELLNTNLKNKMTLTWKNKPGLETGLKVLLQIPVNFKDEN